MKKLFFQLPENTSTQARNAFQIATAIAFAHFVAVPYYVYLMYQGRTTAIEQFLALAVITVMLGVLIGIGAVLSRRGQPTQGIILALGVLVVSYPPIATLVTGLGSVLGLALMLVGPMSAYQALPRRSGWVMAILTIVSGLATLLLDIFGSAARPSLPGIFIQLLAVSVVGVLVFFIVRLSWSGSLRTKLLAAFIGVTITTTGALSAFVIVTTTNNLRGNLERELSALAVNRATRLGDLLDTQINTLTALTLNDSLQLAVKEQNQSYTGNATAIQTEIETKDEQWRAADAADNNADPLVNEHLTNTASLELIEYQKTFPDNIEVFITDVHGGLIGTTNRTSDYNQADESWWKVAYNNGQGSVYISDPLFDESTDKIGVQFALPLRNRYTGAIIGILRTTYILTPLDAILQQKIGQTGEADMYIPGATITRIHHGLLELYPSLLFEQLNAATGQGLAEINYMDDPSVVTQALIQSQSGNPAINKLGWVVIFHQHRVEAFAPVNAQIQGIVIVIVVVVLFAVVAAILLAQLLVRPLAQLTNTAQEIAAGNFSSQAQVTSSDEIGLLASAFNNMTARLRDFISTLESRVAERTRNLELAAEVGRTVSQVRALDVMLKDAAELIRTQFDLYYVQVYLVNPSQTYLNLQAGTGHVGAELLGRNHRLSLNAGSINGHAAIEKQSVVISDTASSPTFKPNPLLPNTSSEMAVPLLIGNKVVGVLDMQSEHAGSLNKDILPAFEALAGQLAIAIQNATFLAETEQARAEVESQARRLTRANWVEYLDAIHKPEETGFVFEQNKIASMTRAEQYRSQININALAAPIEVTGEVLGNLIVEMEGQSPITRVDELVNTVAHQVAQQIENLRLLDSAERFRFEAEQASRRLTSEGWKDYMDTAGEGLSYIYDLKEVRPFHHAEDQLAEGAALSLPLKVRDETIGKLVVQGVEASDSDSLEIINVVAERLGAHIEGLRLSKQTEQALATTQKLAEREQALRQITSAVRGSTDPATILRTAVRELGNMLGRKIIIRMKAADGSEQPDPGAENESAVVSDQVMEA